MGNSGSIERGFGDSKENYSIDNHIIIDLKKIF